MLYHYTDHLTIADIQRAAVLRPASITLHRDMWAQDRGFPTPPIVWLTTAKELEPTVGVKLTLAGWPRDLRGHVGRVAVRGDYPGVSMLNTWSDSVGIDPEWWQWTIRTAAMCKSNWRDWRVAHEEIPAADWQAVELLGRDGKWSKVQ